MTFISCTAPPQITYPTELSKVCGPFDSSICKASGNPPPHTQLLKILSNNNNVNVYTCLSKNTHIDNFGNVSNESDSVNFYGKWLISYLCGLYSTYITFYFI